MLSLSLLCAAEADGGANYCRQRISLPMALDPLMLAAVMDEMEASTL